MQFDARLTGEAASLAREHAELLERLPATVHAFILVELQKWPTLFAPEQRYQRALLEHLALLSKSDLQRAISGVRRVEGEAGVNRIAGREPARFQDEAQVLLRKRRLVQAWRLEVDGFFRKVDPALEARLYPVDAPRRLVIQLYAGGIAVQAGRLWSRFKAVGMRVPLKLERSQGSEGFLRALFGEHDAAAGTPSLFADATASAGFGPLDTWLVESDEALHHLCDIGHRWPRPGGSVAGLSYARLRAYREELTRALYKKIQSGVESPQEFAAYARSLTIAPAPGTLLDAADILQAFVRDVFLTGNGTLFVNNTFVEWAAVQALRRAQPRLLVARFGVRDSFKPFSSLLLFSEPRASDRVPAIEDPVGSFIDVEQLSYYIWLNAEKNAAYRNRTLYLFLAEGFDEMLAIRSDAPAALAAPVGAADLADVHATMAGWLGVPLRGASGRPIPALSNLELDHIL